VSLDGLGGPEYWIAPDMEVRKVIREGHSEYLRINGGHRNEAHHSTHTVIRPEQLVEYEGKWDTLALDRTRRISTTVYIANSGLAHLGELRYDSDHDFSRGEPIGEVYSDEPFDTLKATNRSLAEWMADFHEDPISVYNPYQFVTNLTYRLSTYSYVHSGYAVDTETTSSDEGFIVEPKANSDTSGSPMLSVP
jgi:hypothetical protein